MNTRRQGVVNRTRASPRLVKLHRNYTVEEVALLFGIHKNTVRSWLKAGLEVNDGKRPVLILGKHLSSFLSHRRIKNKRKCAPGELYCVRCRAPKPAAGQMADYIPITTTLGNLVAICPDCSLMMNRRVSLTRLGLLGTGLTITVQQALPSINESKQPTVNSDLRRGHQS